MCSEVTLSKRPFRLIRCVHRTKFVSMSDAGRKSNGRHCKATRLGKTSSRRNISLHSSTKMKDAPKRLKIPTSECTDTWTHLLRHKWPTSWSNIDDPLVFLEPKSVQSPTCQINVGEDNFEKVPSGLEMGTKYRIGNACLFVGNQVQNWMLVGMRG